MLATVDGVVARASSSRPRSPRSRSRSTSRRPAYGIKPGEVRRAAATLVQGIQVGALFERQKVFDVLVVGVPEARQRDRVRELLVDTPSGGSATRRRGRSARRARSRA